MTFQGATYVSTQTFQDQDGDYEDVKSIQITVIDPNGKTVLSNQSAVKDAQGIYSFNYELPINALLGDWTILWNITADDGEDPYPISDVFTCELYQSQPQTTPNNTRTYTSILNELLIKYPRFFYKEPDGNNYKHEYVESLEYIDFNTQKLLVKKSHDLDQPLQLWRNQTIPFQYQMSFRIHIDDIQQVQLYLDGDTPELVFDSGILPEGTDSYENSYWAISEDVIPLEKYYLHVTDYHENVLEKGFPGNDSPQGDIYDHNPALDIMGLKYGVPRRAYKTGLNEIEYPYTYPPYYNYATECDYCYQKRMKQHLIDYNNLSFPVVELKKFFQVDAVIENRARYIVKMNQDVMVDDDDPNNDGKYMATENWNSATYNVGVNLDEVPVNIEVSDEAVQSVLDRTFPISKKGFFIANKTFPGPADPSIACFFGLNDNNIAFALNFPFDSLGFADSVAMSAVMPFAESIGFNEQIILGLPPVDDILGFKDKAMITCVIPVMVLDTNSEFNQGSVGTGLIVSSNKLQVDVAQKNGYIYLNSNQNWEMINNPNSSTHLNFTWTTNGPSGYYGWIATCPSGSTWYQTNYLTWENFGFNIPSNAVILGIELDYNLYVGQSGDPLQTEWHVVSGSKTGIKGQSTHSGAIFKEYTLGSDSDKWGINWTPADIKNLQVMTTMGGVAPTHSVFVDYLKPWVYWEYNGGTYVSTLIPAPTDGSTWNKIVINSTIPTGCNITYDILNADTGAVLLSGKTGSTIDISSLSMVDLEVRANLTANGASTPVINSITAYTTKIYS